MKSYLIRLTTYFYILIIFSYTKIKDTKHQYNVIKIFIVIGIT